MVSKMLGNADRGAISLCCRALFVLINANTPFRAVRIKPESKLHLFEHQSMRRLLLSAVEVRWEIPLNKSSRLWPQNTSSTVSGTALTFRNSLCILSQSSNLSRLYLSDVDVSAPQQETILSIPKLEHLALSGSNFIPGAVVKPSYTSLKRLQLGGRLSSPAIGHTLSLLSESIEELTLVSVYGKGVDVAISVSLLLRLKVLRNLPALGGTGQIAFIRNHPTITHYITAMPHSDFSHLSPAVLPNLDHLRGNAYAARVFAPGRPVRTYLQDDVSSIASIHALNPTLVALGRSTGPVKRLRLIYPSETPGLLQLIAITLPQLESLQLYIGRDDRAGELSNYDYLLGAWCFSPLPKELGQVQGSARFHKLKDIEIRFARTKQTQDGCHPFPRAQCGYIFDNGLRDLCPHLQVAEFIAVDPLDKFPEREAEPAYRAKMQRLGPGKWEERKWV